MKAVTIVGGGIAGLSLGIALRQRGVPCTVLEAGDYPRHRVCGEFISGRGRFWLESLGMSASLRDVGAVFAHDALFVSHNRPTTARSLPYPALCLSRYRLDAFLAQTFQQLGGDLLTATRFTGEFGEGIVRATGRRPQATQDGWRSFGLKAHAENVTLGAGLEMHLGSRGYVGLCRVEDGRVNVCGLFRSQTPVRDLAENWKEWLMGDANSALRRKLAAARWDTASVSFVAGLNLRPSKAESVPEFCVGDSVSMIPPVTGNGMSMALESSSHAVTPLTEWSRGRASWQECRRAAARQLDAAFARRLSHSAWLQRAVLSPMGLKALFHAVRLFPPLQDGLFSITR